MNRVTVLALCAWGLACAAAESRAVDDAAIADA